MGKKFNLNIEAPLGGVVRSTAYQKQPPFTSYHSDNFWPIDARTDRSCLATRPGLSDLDLPAAGKSIQMLVPINGADSGKPYQSMVTAADSDVYWWNGTGWTAATGSQASSVSTGRAVYGASFKQQTFICNNTTRPLMFDYNAGTVELMTEAVGTAPTDVRMAATWQGALWLAGQLATPHILYGSRVGNAADWDASVASSDRFAAYATTGANEGLLTGPITALMPHTNDQMIVSTFSGLLAMRAHPRQGGVFHPISETSYVLGQGAWCKVPGDVLFYLSPLGMMMLEPGAYAVPSQVSRGKIPNELIGLEYNYENPVVSMVYCSRWDAIYLTVRGEQEQAWLYHVPTGSFHRMTFTGYPFVLMEFSPFVTANTSGVLWGGYVSLRFLDRFSTEEFESSVIIGPVKLSETTLEKSIVHQARVVLGRDTPDTGETSTLKIAVGNDGQDAVARMVQDMHQFEGDLVVAGDNNGIVFPKVAGHAAVFSVVQTSGDVVVENIDLLCETFGTNKMIRAPQIAVDSSASDFSDPSDDFDEDLWQGHSCATPIAPNVTLADHTHFIDLSELPASWWAVVATDGRDIRATDGDADPIPFDLIYFDYANNTGFATVKLTQTIPPREVCLWVGNPDAGPLAVDDEFGQYAAYDSNWRAFWPSGGARDAGEEDRTQFLNHIVLANQVDEDNLTDGLIGVEATDYVFVDATNNYGRATTSIPSTAYPTTFVVVARDTDTTSLPCLGMRDQSGPSTANVELTVNRDATNQRADAGSTDTGASAAEDQSNSLANSANYRQFVAVISAADSRTAYIDGGNDNAPNTTTITIASGVLDEIVIGKGSRSGLSASSTTADLSLAQVHDTARSEDWINYQYRMLDQPVFWGGWDEFDEINPPPPEPDPDPGACPLGIVPVVETGSWSGYAEATPVEPTQQVNDWTHFINLALMPANWWSAVASDGHDIRATDEDNVFIPLDLIEFDSTLDTGFATVKLSQNTAQARPIRLWVGNATAVTVSPCAAYGQYKAYDDDWLAFYPSGGGDDRTQWQRHLTDQGGITVGGVTGPIGNTATSYNSAGQGSGQKSFTATAFDDISPLDVMLVSVSRVNSPNVFEQAAHVTVRNEDSNSSIVLAHAPDSTPGRYYVFNSAGAYLTAYQNIVQNVGTWYHQAGFSRGNTIRQLWINGAGDGHADGQPLAAVGLDQVVIGSRITDSINSWEFVGDLTLLQIHGSVRSFSSSWAAYQTAMLTQLTFWDSPWTWTAQVSSLPQP